MKSLFDFMEEEKLIFTSTGLRRILSIPYDLSPDFFGFSPTLFLVYFGSVRSLLFIVPEQFPFSGGFLPTGVNSVKTILVVLN